MGEDQALNPGGCLGTKEQGGGVVVDVDEHLSICEI